MNILFTKPFWSKEEMSLLDEAVKNRKGGGNGPYCKKSEEKIKLIFKVKHVFLTPSCTHAIELAIHTLNIKQGDEVICPSFTFVSIANAIIQQGAKPVFTEIKEDTLNIDPDDIERKISKKTRAIVPVHYAGVSCEMDKIMRIAKNNKIFVIEDAAQAVGAKYFGLNKKEKWLGTIGDIGCYSFHETKNFSCGEGGAFLTNNEIIAKKAEIIREKGTDRSAFLRGETDKYVWKDKGSSYLLSDLLAAVLYAQFNKMEEINIKREKIFKYYMEAFSEIEKRGLIKLPKIQSCCQPNYHMFYFLTRNEIIRNKYLMELNRKGIEATFHYIPLHSSPYGIDALKYRPEDLPITEKIAKTIVRLPIYPELTQKEQNYIIEVSLKILKSIN